MPKLGPQVLQTPHELYYLIILKDFLSFFYLVCNYRIASNLTDISNYPDTISN